MRTARHNAEQIIDKLREAEALLAAGATVAVICRRQGISEHTYYRWRRRYGPGKTDEAARLNELEIENQRLREKVARQALDIEALWEGLRGKSGVF